MSWAEAMSDGWEDSVQAEIAGTHSRDESGARVPDPIFYHRTYRCAACAAAVNECEHLADAIVCDGSCLDTHHRADCVRVAEDAWACAEDAEAWHEGDDDHEGDEPATAADLGVRGRI